MGQEQLSDLSILSIEIETLETLKLSSATDVVIKKTTKVPI